jgi:hypothetical protein
VEDFVSLEALLIWIISGGGAMVLVGYVMAFLLENWPAWHNFPRWVKVLVPIALAAVFGFGANGVLALELLDYIPVPIQTLILMLINWLFGQFAYRGIKDGAYAASARGY